MFDQWSVCVEFQLTMYVQMAKYDTSHCSIGQTNVFLTIYVWTSSYWISIRRDSVNKLSFQIVQFKMYLMLMASSRKLKIHTFVKSEKHEVFHNAIEMAVNRYDSEENMIRD